jgi:hypothetical protein
MDGIDDIWAMATTPINPVRQAVRRYFIEFAISMTAYVATIWVSRSLLYGPMRTASPGWQYVVALLPLVPILLVFAAVVRYMLGVDELIRRMQVDSLALAGGATALIAAGYGLIEGDYAPKLSAWWTFVTFMMAWLIASFFVRRRYQ